MTMIPMKKSRFSAFRKGLLSGAARGGPARLVAIVGVAALMIGAVVVVSIQNEEKAPESQAAKMKTGSLLPGGLHATAAQEALRVKHSQEEAQKAEAAKQSYTPAIPGSKLFVEPRAKEVGLDFGPEPVKLPTAVREPAPVPPPPPLYVPPEKPAAAADAAPKRTQQFGGARIEKIAVSEPVEMGQAQPMNAQTRKAFDDLFRGYEVRSPQTRIEIQPAALKEGDEGRQSAGTVGRSATSGPAPAVASAAAERVLVPAGRGIYAHTVLSVNSDAGGPIVLEADTGPLAGDRMIGAFSKSGNDRLVVRIQTIEHRGKSLEANGLVVAPDSMETSVATSVDQHYLERFVFPAAAAFVQGLGQAVQTANSTVSVSPFGGTVQQFGPMKFKDEAMVGAGAGAAAIGNILTSTTPKGPTINLAANVGVGVMFLLPVTIRQ